MGFYFTTNEVIYNFGSGQAVDQQSGRDQCRNFGRRSSTHIRGWHRGIASPGFIRNLVAHLVLFRWPAQT